MSFAQVPMTKRLSHRRHWVNLARALVRVKRRHKATKNISTLCDFLRAFIIVFPWNGLLSLALENAWKINFWYLVILWQQSKHFLTRARYPYELGNQPLHHCCFVVSISSEKRFSNGNHCHLFSYFFSYFLAYSCTYKCGVNLCSVQPYSFQCFGILFYWTRGQVLVFKILTIRSKRRLSLQDYHNGVLYAI